MTIANLIAKLNKLNISYTIDDLNGYCKTIIFSVNGRNVYANFYETGEKPRVDNFSVIYGYNDAIQEQCRFFFKTLNRVFEFLQTR